MAYFQQVKMPKEALLHENKKFQQQNVTSSKDWSGDLCHSSLMVDIRSKLSNLIQHINLNCVKYKMICYDLPYYGICVIIH